MYNDLKQEINEKITANGMGLITGTVLNEVLNKIVDTLGNGYRFGGILNPGSFEPNKDGLFYIAYKAGTYWGGFGLDRNEIAIVYYSNTAWHADYVCGYPVNITPAVDGKLNVVEYNRLQCGTVRSITCDDGNGTERVFYFESEDNDYQYYSTPVRFDNPNRAYVYRLGLAKAVSQMQFHNYTIISITITIEE